MKIKISYLPEEEQSAAAAQKALQSMHLGIKVRKSDRHPPYKQIYLSMGVKNETCKPSENAV